MHVPSVDIIVPVWNSPFETRACLAAILAHSPQARLIIVDNASSRETQLMLEEFSEPLGERGLFIDSERNVGMVRAINMGLARSDSDCAIIVRPHVMTVPGWLEALLEAAQSPQAGIVSPLFNGAGAPPLPHLSRGCTLMETFEVSFCTLLLRGEMHMLLGGFNETMDNGEWCLKEYVRRAWNNGYHTLVTSRTRLECGPETVFGSAERRREIVDESARHYRELWGAQRHYAVYFPADSPPEAMPDAVESIMAGARLGHRFSLLLHRRQAAEFKRRGWNALHTGIRVEQLPLFMPQRSLQRRVAAIRVESPDVILVRGIAGSLFPESDTAMSLADVTQAIASSLPPARREHISGG